MADLRISSTPADALKDADHLVVAGPAAALRGSPWKKLSRAGWTKALARLAAETDPGELGQCATSLVDGRAPGRVTVLALPDEPSRLMPPSSSHALAAAWSKARLSGRGTVAVLLVPQRPEHLLPLALAVARSTPLYDRRTDKARARRSQASSAKVRLSALDPAGGGMEIPRPVREAVEALRWSARLVDTPASDMTTADFVDEVRQAFGRRRSVEVRETVGRELIGLGLRGIHAVGQAAEVPPRLLVLEHAPAAAERTVALVGKGVVFDSGGLALKSREGMLTMKSDMGGAAAVAGAFRALVAGKPKARLLAVIPLAENAIGPGSYRPGDVLALHSGRTVEITNTDAEGRLLLHDAVSWAAREAKADLVVDAATLTGAQGMATGRRHAGAVSDDEALEDLAVAAGLATGEPVHPLLWAPELHRPQLRSEIADMVNSVRDRQDAPSSCAAWFVQQGLAGTGAAWLHVDMASPAFVDERATGFGAALLAEVVRRWLDAASS